MDSKNVEKVTALAFLFIGLVLLFIGLSLSGLLQVPLLGIIVLLAGIVSVITALVLYADSGSQSY